MILFILIIIFILIICVFPIIIIKNKKLKLLLLSILFLGYCILFIIFLYFKPPTIWYFINLFTKDKKKLIKPVFIEKLNLTENNYSKIISFKPDNFGIYELELFKEDQNFNKNKFIGKLKIEIIENDFIIIDEFIINKIIIGYYMDNSNKKIFKGTICYIKYPYKNKFKNLKMRITVIEPDKSFESNGLFNIKLRYASF